MGVGRRRRWEFVINNKEKEETIMSEKYIWNFLKPWLSKKDATLERKTIYTFKSAISKSWRKGRIFIAGDAAHLMPPFLGQGMCTGIRDVANLAWKLAAVLRWKAPDSLLDSYESERREHTRTYIETAVRVGEMMPM